MSEKINLDNNLIYSFIKKNKIPVNKSNQGGKIRVLGKV